MRDEVAPGDSPEYGGHHFEFRRATPNQTLARGPEFMHPILAPVSGRLNVLRLPGSRKWPCVRRQFGEKLPAGPCGLGHTTPVGGHTPPRVGRAKRPAETGGKLW